MPRFRRKRTKPSVITLADRARDTGQWERAAEYYRDALHRKPENPPIWVQYGHVLKESGHLAEAEKAYRTAVAYDRRSADSHLQLGHVLKIQGKKKEALGAYLRAVELDPSVNGGSFELTQIGWSEAHVSELRGMLGTTLTNPMTFQSASSAYAEPFVNPDSSRATHGKSQRNRLQLPLQALKRSRPSRITLADRARDAGQWDLAAQHYREALSRNPHNSPIWVQYGHALKESGLLAEAEKAYRTALAYDPRIADSHVQLGHVLKIQGKKVEAQAAYLRAVAFDPSLDGASFELAGLGWSDAHFSELRGMLRSGVSRLPIPTPENCTLDRDATAAVRKAGHRDDSEISQDRPTVSAAMPQPPNAVNGTEDYADWIKLYDTIDDNDRGAIATAIGKMTDPPLISVVMPVYNTPEPYLRAAIDSVRQQLYPHWELCIADDASTVPHVRAVLEGDRAIDPRIKVCYRSENGHIAAASNSALALAQGSFVALLDHDDVLPEHALYVVAAVLDADPEIDLIYSDEDKIDENGQRFGPHFKSDWNPDLMLSQNMFCHLGIYRRSLIEKIGGFRCGYEGSQDYDLVLRAQSLTPLNRIHHIPHILYHRRESPNSAAFGSEEKESGVERARQAIRDHLAERGITAEVSASPCPFFHRVRYALPEPAPRVTVIIPTRDRVDLLSRCVEGLLHRTDYPDIEILIVDNQSKEPATRVYFDQLIGDPRIRMLSYDAPFNYSAINNFAVARATGSLLCFLNNDIEVIKGDWLTEMVSHALRPGIGAVGALLYYPDGHTQHSGVVLGRGGVAGHVHTGLRRDEFGYFGRAAVAQNLSAVTAACLVMPKAVFDEVGGLNEKDLAVAYNDVDLCLRVREAGYRIVWTPHAELYHYESASRGSDTDPDNAARSNAEVSYMLRRWGYILESDPYYNPNLSLDGPAFGLAFPPRVDRSWRHVGSRWRILTGLSRDARSIAESGRFDPGWYIAQNPDVAAAGVDPLAHYLESGYAEGRRPSPLFDPAWYRAQSPDLAPPRKPRDSSRLVYVSGEPETPGHQYRVVRPMAWAARLGAENTWMRVDEIPSRLAEIEAADAIILWRTPCDEHVSLAIETARRHRAKVLFDVDDLMIDPELARADLIDGIRTQGFMEEPVRQHFARMRSTMLAADLCLTTTDELATHLRQAGMPTVVLPNAFDHATLGASRLAARRVAAMGRDGLVRIGYAGGTRTHQRDFAVCAETVAEILRGNADCRLVAFRSADGSAALLGVEEFPALRGLEDKIEWRNFVPLNRLPDEIARFDVNLAPLELGNPYCEAKSELKFFEAALAGVPTIASSTGPYRRAIRHGETGFLAATPNEWREALAKLVTDPLLRHCVSAAARRDVTWSFGPERSTEAMASLLDLLRGGRDAARSFERDALRRRATPAMLPPLPEHDVVFEADQLRVAEVTVIVPLYNYAGFVEEALNSVAAQTLRELDLVVIDDNSTDDALSVVLDWAKTNATRFNRLSILHNRANSGLGAARNIGFDIAETPFVLPLDADNRLLPTCAAACLEAAQASGAAFAYPVIKEFGAKDGLMGVVDYDPVRLANGNYVDAMALVSKAVWAALGGYDHVRTGWEDFDFWCKLAERGLWGIKVPGGPLAEYRVHSNSMIQTDIARPETFRAKLDHVERRHPWLTHVWPLPNSSRDGNDTVVATRSRDDCSRVMRFLPILRCPETGGRLTLIPDRNALVSEDGSRHWPLVRGRPVLFPGMSAPKVNPDAHLSNPLPASAVALIRGTPGLVLNLSAGGTRELYDNVIEAEAAIFRHTDVIADVHRLPFADGAFEAAISLNAFEHYRDPWQAAREIYRVLRPGGRVLIHTAFLQPLHEAPWHFYNCTRYGLEAWFEEFDTEMLHVSENFHVGYSLSWLASECETALRGRLSAAAADSFLEAPLERVVSMWRAPDTRKSDLLWPNLDTLPQDVQEALGAGFEYLGRRPE